MTRPVALITGASSGIGAALAEALADTHDLVLVARRADRLDSVAERLRPRARVQTLARDLASCDEIELVAEVLGHYGRLDAVVLNAGVFVTGEAQEQKHELTRSVLQLNLEHPMRLVAAALPSLRTSKGVVVGISSIAAESAFPGCGLYAASKAGLEAYLRSVREEERATGVRCTICAPGPTDTEVWPEDCPFDRQKMSSSADVATVIAQVVRQPATVSLERIRLTPLGGSL